MKFDVSLPDPLYLSIPSCLACEAAAFERGKGLWRSREGRGQEFLLTNTILTEVVVCMVEVYHLPEVYNE